MELMVVISIATVLITSVIIQQDKWNDQLVVSSQTYEMTLMYRQAQYYSLAVREDVGGGGDKFNTSYGVYINIDDQSIPKYVFFADRDQDIFLDSGEAMETKTLTRGVTIDRICDVQSNGTENCRKVDGSGGNGNLRKVGVTFLRPSTNARIQFWNGGNNESGSNEKVKVYLKSPKGKENSITIDVNGQISVSQ